MTSRRADAGFGMLDAMIGLAIMGIFVAALHTYVDHAVGFNSELEERESIELARQFFKHNSDCDKTFKMLTASDCGVPGKYIGAYAKDGSLLAKADQTSRLPLPPGDSGIGLIGIRVSCVNPDQLFVEVKQYDGTTGTKATKNYNNGGERPNDGWVDPFHGIPACAARRFYKIPNDLTCYHKTSGGTQTSNVYSMVSSHGHSGTFYENICNYPTAGKQTSGSVEPYFLITVNGVQGKYYLGDTVPLDPDSPIPASLTYQLSGASNPTSWSTKESEIWTTHLLDIHAYFPDGKLVSSPNPNSTGNGRRSDGSFLMSVTRGHNSSRRPCDLRPTATANFPGCW